MSRTLRVALAMVVLLVLAASCAAEPKGDASRIEAQLADRLTEPDAERLGHAVNTFGFELLAVVPEKDGNKIISPVSVSTLLALVLAGAEGETATEMASVLHLEESRDERLGGLLLKLSDSSEVTLSVANAIWADVGIPLNSDYLDYVTDTFGATAKEADLGLPATADEIDQWAKDNTGGRIDKIASDLGLPSDQIILALLNAVYFLGDWTNPFDPSDTRTEPFHQHEGKVDVPLMHRSDAKIEYVESDDFSMVRIPYGKNKRYRFEIALPNPHSSLTELLTQMDAAKWRTTSDGATETVIQDLAIPRFELRWDAELTKPLQSLGMELAFGAGDFSRMSPAATQLEKVVHKTYLRVDEKGTEAAAVTGGVMPVSAPAVIKEFRVDRPFAFAITDRETATILFVGAISNPK